MGTERPVTYVNENFKCSKMVVYKMKEKRIRLGGWGKGVVQENYARSTIPCDPIWKKLAVVVLGINIYLPIRMSYLKFNLSR